VHGRSTGLLAVLVLLAGCDRCSEDVPGRLRADEPVPYIRCLAADPPPARRWKLGALGLEIEGRKLTIHGLPRNLRLAAFSGPAFAADSPRKPIRCLAKAGADLGLMLGGAGDRRSDAARTLKLLGELRFPTLVLAGGRDCWPHLRSALDSLDAAARDQVIDITTLAEVQLGREVLLPVAGAADGRYALGKDACGFGEADLESRASLLGPGKGERRWLVSWETPGAQTPYSPARTAGGIDVGSALLAGFAKRTGVKGGVFAWPFVQVFRPLGAKGEGKSVFDEPLDDLRVVVPRIAGPAMERDNGSRQMPGFAMLSFSASGIAVAPP
jgi:hypothetical protein